MPISEPGHARFRGPTSSNEYNDMEDDHYADLVNLFKAINDNELSLQFSKDAALTSDKMIGTYISFLEGRVTQLENKLDQLQIDHLRSSKIGLVSDMTAHYPDQDQDKTINDSRCQIDFPFRHATLPKTSQIPKTYLTDKNKEVVIPEQLEITVTRNNTTGVIDENDIRMAFNGDNNEFWIRKVSYDIGTEPNEEDVIVDVSLPQQLVNNLNVNTILIHPHPELGIEVKNVEISTANGYETVPGFNQDEVASLSQNLYAPRKKYYFPQKPVQHVRLTLVQHHPIKMNDKMVFILGAQEIGVYLTSFEPSGSFVLTHFDMSKVGVYSIESVDHIFQNRDTFSYPRSLDNLLENNLYNYEILIPQNNSLVPISNSQWSNLTAKEIWVKTVLYPDPGMNNGVNPCLHAVRLNYYQS
jgi:hypothetical protein